MFTDNHTNRALEFLLLVYAHKKLQMGLYQNKTRILINALYN